MRIAPPTPEASPLDSARRPTPNRYASQTRSQILRSHATSNSRALRSAELNLRPVTLELASQTEALRFAIKRLRCLLEVVGHTMRAIPLSALVSKPGVARAIPHRSCVHRFQLTQTLIPKPPLPIHPALRTQGAHSLRRTGPLRRVTSKRSGAALSLVARLVGCVWSKASGALNPWGTTQAIRARAVREMSAATRDYY